MKNARTKKYSIVYNSHKRNMYLINTDGLFSSNKEPYLFTEFNEVVNVAKSLSPKVRNSVTIREVDENSICKYYSINAKEQNDIKRDDRLPYDTDTTFVSNGNTNIEKFVLPDTDDPFEFINIFMKQVDSLSASLNKTIQQNTEIMDQYFEALKRGTDPANTVAYGNEIHRLSKNIESCRKAIMTLGKISSIEEIPEKPDLKPAVGPNVLHSSEITSTPVSMEELGGPSVKKAPYHKWTEDDYKILEDDLAKKLAYKEIASHIGCSFETIRNRASKLQYFKEHANYYTKYGAVKSQTSTTTE